MGVQYHQREGSRLREGPAEGTNPVEHSLHGVFLWECTTETGTGKNDASNDNSNDNSSFDLPLRLNLLDAQSH